MSVFYHPFTISNEKLLSKTDYLKCILAGLSTCTPYQDTLFTRSDINQVEKHGPKGILKGTPEAVLLASILKPKYLMSNDKPYSIFTLFVAHFLLFTNLFN